jgi:thymidine kinase
MDYLPNGRIEVISGCMFAGKTDELLRRLRRAEIAGLDIRVFSPEIDDRYGETVIGSHNGEEWDARVISVDSPGVNDLISEGMGADIVAIDEFNFFTEGFVYAVEELADYGTRVIVTGLDQTFRGEPFEPMDELLAIADTVDKLTAVCEVCGSDATKTQRLIDKEPASYNSPTVHVGGSESYEARCRDCHKVPLEETE